MKQQWVFIWVSIVFIALSLILYHVVPSVHQDIDSKAYVYHAQALVEHGTIIDQAQPYYALGYAYFLAGTFALFGQSTWVIIFVQALLTLLSFIVIARIAQVLFGHSVGIYAVILCCMSVGYYVFTQFILTEVLLAFFLLLFLERLCAGALGSAGLALGLSVIVKPAALYFAVPVALILFARTRDSFTIPSIMFFLCMFYLPVLGYMVHNKILFNTFRVSSLGIVNMCDWYLPNLVADRDGISQEKARNYLRTQFPNDDDFTHRSRYLVDTVRQNPLCALRVWGKNMMKTAVGLYATNLKILVAPSLQGANNSFFATKGTLLQRVFAYVTQASSHVWVSIVAWYEVFFSVLRWVLCVFGLYVLYTRRQWFAVSLCVMYLGYFFGITGHDGCARFRMMSEGMIIVLAAGGLQQICNKEKL